MPDINFLVDIFLLSLFSSLTISSYCLLVSMVSEEKLVQILLKDSMFVMSHLSLVVFNIFSLSFTFDSLIIIANYFGVDFFDLSYLEFVELLGCVD